jgi:hypothetical protein
VYVFVPSIQFRCLMPDKHDCIHCKSNDTRYNMWCWKPYHWWDKVVYCLHQHVLCNKYGATFATVDHPESLATLPTEVFEQFPFMPPSKSGPGIYTPMVLMLVSLLPHSVMLGTFANSINTLQRINYLCTVTCVIFGQGSMLVQRA